LSAEIITMTKLKVKQNSQLNI